MALVETASARGFNPTAMVYVEAARHLLAGQGMSTDILFTTSVPRLPSPLSVWGPFYPVTAAGLAWIGLDVAVAARVSSVLAFGLSVVLVWWLGSVLFGPRVGTASALLVSVWPAVLRQAATAGSESLFVLLLLGSAAATVRSMRLGGTAGSRWALVGGLAMGAASLTRYAGIPLVPLGGAALFVFARSLPLRERFLRVGLWTAAGALPIAGWLARNLATTGTLIGAGRQPDDLGLSYHLTTAARTVAHDVLELAGRLLIVPEFAGPREMALTTAFLGAALVVLAVTLQRSLSPRTTALSIRVLLRTGEAGFVLTLGIGYWVSMIAARTVIGFYPLDSRLMMPAYPLVMVGMVAAGAALVDRVWPKVGPRWGGIVGWLCVATLCVVVFPRSLAAGGPRLSPGPAPPWVRWVQTHTPEGALVVGNLSYDYNFYLDRPVVQFSGNPYGVSRFDCRAVGSLLERLRRRPAYFVVREERGRFDPEVMRRLHGPLIGELVAGERTPLPVRLVARSPDFVAYEILDRAWTCR
ncbi:MAG: glycosyltransferase family 39 protein [Armatimonadota bacterium]|nr:glycosyltransferase family 39 protein [Armatimonadota bacterium]